MLNVFALSAYAIELWKDYDVILDNDSLTSSKRKYIVRLVISSAVFFVALNVMYGLFKISTVDILNYFKYGR